MLTCPYRADRPMTRPQGRCPHSSIVAARIGQYALIGIGAVVLRALVLGNPTS